MKYVSYPLEIWYDWLIVINIVKQRCHSTAIQYSPKHRNLWFHFVLWGYLKCKKLDLQAIEKIPIFSIWFYYTIFHEKNNPLQNIPAYFLEPPLYSKRPKIYFTLHRRTSIMRYKRNFFAAAAILTLAVSIPSQADTTPKLDSVNHQAYIAGSSGYFLPDEELSRA